MPDYRLAKIAYDAYREYSKGRSLISGDKLPGFDDLKSDIKDAWARAASAVASDVRDRVEDSSVRERVKDSLFTFNYPD